MRTALDRPLDDEGPDVDDEAMECLIGTQLNSFNTTPTTIQPFGGPATLRWSVSVPVACRVGLGINGRAVGRSGSLEVLPAVDTAYTLTASVRGASRVLGRVTVDVDTSACVTRELTESVLRGPVEQSLASFESDDERAYDLSLDSFEIRSTGLQMSLHMKLEIGGFVDPRVDVDFVIGLNIDDGVVRPYYRSFTVDVDWPWWVTTLTIGVTKIVEEFLDGGVEDNMKPKVLAKVQEVIDGLVALLPDGMRVHSLRLTEDAILVTACPDGDVIPTRVLAVPAGVGTAAKG